jgi:flagellar FliL protein
MTVTAIPQAPAKAAEEPKEKKSKKKLIIILVAVIALAGGAYMFVLKPKPTGPPIPGNVVKLDPIQINLASSHYLRLTMALQMVQGAPDADGSKAADAAINIFSGLPMSEVNQTSERLALKKVLEKKLGTLYDKQVMGVYFAEFVTQ